MSFAGDREHLDLGFREVPDERVVHLSGPATPHRDPAHPQVLHCGNDGLGRGVAGNAEPLLRIVHQLQHPLAAELDGYGDARQDDPLSAAADQVGDEVVVAAHGLVYPLHGVIAHTKAI